MKKFILFLVQLPILIGCQLGIDEYNVFEKDFLFDTFDTLDEEIWQRINNSIIGLSELRSENVFTSNGNLVIKITKNPPTSGGISSKKLFKNGSFSIFAVNPNTNIVLELEVNIPKNYSRAILRYYFLENESKTIIEAEILSPYETLIEKFENIITNINTPLILTIITSKNNIEMSVNEQKLTNYSLRHSIELAEVRINSYVKAIDLDFLERNVLIDYFKYQKN